MVRINQRDLQTRERCPITRVSSWLQGVPGHNGLPGQPGLTAELVGTGQISSPSPSPTLLGAEFATPAPLASGGSLFPPSSEAGRSLDALWLPKASPYAPSPHTPAEPLCLSLAGILAH